MVGSVIGTTMCQLFSPGIAEEQRARLTHQKAICVIRGDAGVSGVVNFSRAPDRGASTIIEGQIEGLGAGLHGFHVHEWGDNSQARTFLNLYYSCAGMR